jgi:hypothetical protein
VTYRWIVAAALLALAGCGEKYVAVSGTVNYGGHPLAAGYVTFEPEPGSGTTGPGATAPVTDGRFEIPAAEKLTPGKYVVRVGPPLLGSGMDAKVAATTFTPWVTKAELGPGTGPLTFDVPKK